MEELKITQNLEIFDIVYFINKKKRLHQKLLLDGIEMYMDKDSNEYKAIRKLVLDNTNELIRSIVRTVLGDTFEGLIK